MEPGDESEGKKKRIEEQEKNSQKETLNDSFNDPLPGEED